MASNNKDDCDHHWQDVQTSPVSSPYQYRTSFSSSGQPIRWRDMPTRSHSSQSTASDTPIDPSKCRIHLLPIEIQDEIVGCSEYHDVRRIWALFSPVFASLARKHLLKDQVISFKYPEEAGEEGDGKRTRSLLSLLERHPECAKYVQYLDLVENSASLENRIADIKGRFWNFDAEDSEELIDAATVKFQLSPCYIFHDKALGSILSRMTSLKSLWLTCSENKLDLRQYDEEHSNAFSRVFKLKTLTSIQLKGVSNLYLPHIRLVNLDRMSLYNVDLLVDPSMDSPSLGTSSEGKSIFARPRIMKLCNINGVVEPFMVSLKNPTSNIDLSRLVRLEIDIRNFDDIILCGALLDAGSPSFERLKLTTQYLYGRNSNNLPDSRTYMSPIKLSKLVSLKSLVIRLNFLATVGFEGEIDWFLENLRDFGLENALEEIKFTIDVANRPNYEQSDGECLQSYTGWDRMDSVFVGKNMKGLKSFKIIISTSVTDPFDPSYSLTEEIKLPRLAARSIYSTAEAFDFPCRNNTRRNFLEDSDI